MEPIKLVNILNIINNGNLTNIDFSFDLPPIIKLIVATKAKIVKKVEQIAIFFCLSKLKIGSIGIELAKSFCFIKKKL